MQWPAWLETLAGMSATTHSLNDIFASQRLRGDTQTPDGEPTQFEQLLAVRLQLLPLLVCDQIP